MSTQVEQVFIDWFDSEVKRSYGDKQKLAGMCYEKTVTGSKAFFPKKGKSLATRHNSGSDVSYNNTDFSRVECELLGWEAFDLSDIFDSKNINFSEVTELAETTGDAIGLRMDQVKIDALDDGRNTTDDRYTVGDTSEKLTVADLNNAKYILGFNGVPSNDRYFLHSADQTSDLLDTTEVTSADYNTVKTLVNGEIDTFMGFKFVEIAGNRLEGGLPTGNDGANDYVRGFIYHKEALGFAKNMDINSSIDWIATKQAWQVGAKFQAGAVVRDNEAIVAVESIMRG